jgi:hypothetical protein
MSGAKAATSGRLAARALPSTVPSGGGGARLESGTDLAVLDRTAAEGVFVVTVTGVRCGVRRVGRVPAKGQFCLVEVVAENAGREAHRLDGGAQRAVDARGRAYAIAGRAAAVLNTLRQEIAPGATVRGVLPFDVPRGARLSTLVLHESAGSRGARVALS